MKLVSGSLGDDWYPLTPGDMVVSTCKVRLSWPPDGCGHWYDTDGRLKFARLRLKDIEPGHPLLLVAHVRRRFDGVFQWYRGTWSIVHDGERLWWLGTGVSGSM